MGTRVRTPQASVINGVDAGGTMQVRLQKGYDNILVTPADGLQVGLKDREIQYCRGTLLTQDWVEAINILTGTVGTYVFYEQEVGLTTFTKHTITNPIIHRMLLRIVQGRYAGVTFDFECKAASASSTIADMHAVLSAQTAPSYVSAARGGYRIKSAKHDLVTPINITGMLSFDFSIVLPLLRICNDSDVGYTVVEAITDGLQAMGSISFDDSTVATGQLLETQLLLAARDDLVIQVNQAQAATDKVITVAGVTYDSDDRGSNGGSNQVSAQTVNFSVGNDTTTQLTLAGENKIITVEDAA